MQKKIEVQGIAVSVKKESTAEYISLTDIAKYKSDEPNEVLRNWLRNKDTIEFLGLWEKINNPDFKPVEFDGFRSQAGSNAFTMSPTKWIDKTNAIGLITSSGKYGGTFAHKDIAFEFASWVSAEFKLYLIKEFQRLVEAESSRLNLEWTVRYIKVGMSQSERLVNLNRIAIEQMKVLTESCAVNGLKKLEGGDDE